METLSRVVAAVGRRRVTAVAVVLAMVLSVVGLSAGWAAASTSAFAPSTGPSAQVERDGLLLTMRVSPGPYYLRELLLVSVSLSNRSSANVLLRGPIRPHMGFEGGCGSAFDVMLNGGHAPTFQPLTTGSIMMCPPLPGSKFAAGQTVTASNVLPITASGHMTLTADVETMSFVSVSSQGQTYTQQTGRDPFAGHRPTVKLTVSPTVPAGRTILLTRFGTRVFIIAPPEALSRLYYEYSASVSTRSDSCVTGSYGWGQITTPWVDYLPRCGHYGTWDFAVGAPGYAIAQGSVSA